MLTKKNNPHRNAILHVCARRAATALNYSNEILRIESLAGCSDIFQTASKLLQGFWSGGRANFRISH